MDSDGVIFLRLTHTGVYADGRPNRGSVTLYDLDEPTIQKNRPRFIPIPVESTVDIPMSTRTFISWAKGSIATFVAQGLLRAEIIIQLRDKQNCGGPDGTGQGLRPGVLNAERQGNLLRLVIPDNVIPANVDSMGYLQGEPVEIRGLSGDFSKLNGEYEISSVSPGQGLAGAQAGSYLVELPSVGPNIPPALLAGVKICLTNGRVVVEFSSGGDIGGLGPNVFGYVAGQLLPSAGGGGGGPGTLADVLSNGNSSGGNNIVLSTGDALEGQTDLVLTPGPGAGDVLVLDGLTWPSSDGAPGDVLTTDGMGNLTFQTVGSTEVFISGEALSTGDLLTLNATGNVIRANSSIGAAHYEVVGVSTQTVGAGSPVQVVLRSGVTTNINFTAAPPAMMNGSFVFLSTTSGLASMSPPSPPNGNAFVKVGVLRGADGVTMSPAVVFRPEFVALCS